MENFISCALMQEQALFQNHMNDLSFCILKYLVSRRMRFFKQNKKNMKKTDKNVNKKKECLCQCE